MGGRWGRELSRWLNTTLVKTDDLHAIERGLKLLEPLGVASPAVNFQVPETDAHRRAAEAIIERLRLDNFVLIISGAGWPSKLWPVDRYAAVADYLGRRWNLASLLIWGNDSERARAGQIAAASAGRAVLAPRVPLLELAALARRAGSPSVPILGHCTWPRLSARRASGCMALGRPTSTVPTAPNTLTCKKCAWTARRTSAATRRRSTWKPSTCIRSARHVTAWPLHISGRSCTMGSRSLPCFGRPLPPARILGTPCTRRTSRFCTPFPAS